MSEKTEAEKAEPKSKAGSPRAQMYAALARAQAKIHSAKKDSTNPHFGSKYADLAAVTDAIREPLTSEGFGWTQEVSSTTDGVKCVTTLLHSTGEELRGGDLWLPVLQKTPQAYGSTITYARRYSLGAAVGVASDEDDDGNAASKAPTAAPAGVAALKHAAAAPKPTEEPPPHGEEDAPAASHDRTLTFKFGKDKGTPLAKLSDDSVSWYRSCIQRDIADPMKAQWARIATLQLATVDAELRLRGLPVGA